MTIRLIDAGTVPYVRSQSLYHGLGHSQKKNTPDTIVLAIPASRYICIGNFQDPDLEINLAYCEKNNLPLIRRQTGGGAVYIDENQLFIQWIFQPGSLPARVNRRFELFVKPLIETHKFFGIDAYFHPVNDVHVNGKKIVGTGAATIGNAEVVTGNFLFDFNYNAMSDALNLPGRLLKEMVEQSLKDYVTTIGKEIGRYEPEEWKSIYLKQLELQLGRKMTFGEITDPEREAIERWDQKLVSPEWVYGNKGKSKLIRMVKIHSGFWIGSVEINSGSAHGRIQLGLNENRIEKIQIELDKELKLTNAIVNGLQEMEIAPGLIEERIRTLLNGCEEEERIMSPEEWAELIFSIKKEKDRLAGNA